MWKLTNHHKTYMCYQFNQCDILHNCCSSVPITTLVVLYVLFLCGSGVGWRQTDRQTAINSWTFDDERLELTQQFLDESSPGMTDGHECHQRHDVSSWHRLTMTSIQQSERLPQPLFHHILICSLHLHVPASIKISQHQTSIYTVINRQI